MKTFPGMFALRYPFRAPEDDLGGGEVDPAFVEQPGDREEEPAAAEEPEPEPAAEEEPATEEEPAEEEPAEEPAAEAEAEEEEEPAPKKKDWRDRQIIKARQAEKTERERREAADAEIARLKAIVEADPDKVAALSPDVEEAAVQKAMARLTEKQRFEKINQGADAMFDAGKAAFPKTWEKRVADAGEVFRDEIIAKPEFLEAVTELENAAAVYHELAGDPDKMEEVLNLPPHKMGMELARMSAKLAAAPKPKPVSRTPAPITPLAKPTMEDRSLDDLANDPSPAAMREFDRRMALEEDKKYAKR